MRRRSRRAPRCWRCRCPPRCAPSPRAARRRWRSPPACPCPPATTRSRSPGPPPRARPPAHRPSGRPPGPRATPPPFPVASRQYVGVPAAGAPDAGRSGRGRPATAAAGPARELLLAPSGAGDIGAFADAVGGRRSRRCLATPSRVAKIGASGNAAEAANIGALENVVAVADIGAFWNRRQRSPASAPVIQRERGPARSDEGAEGLSPGATRRRRWSGAHDRCRGATCWRPSESRSGTAVPCRGGGHGRRRGRS